MPPVTRLLQGLPDHVEDWDLFFFAMAELVSLKSKDPSTQVGAVVVDSSRRVLSVGYNGFPRGVLDLPERYADRPLKYLLVQHAERNALASSAASGTRVQGATMYAQGVPCNECAKGIIDAGIAEVVVPVVNDFDMDPARRQRWMESRQVAQGILLQEAGVRVREWVDPRPSTSGSPRS